MTCHTGLIPHLGDLAPPHRSSCHQRGNVAASSKLRTSLLAGSLGWSIRDPPSQHPLGPQNVNHLLAPNGGTPGSFLAASLALRCSVGLPRGSGDRPVSPLPGQMSLGTCMPGSSSCGCFNLSEPPKHPVQEATLSTFPFLSSFTS